jgi:hypothetical protein
MRETFALLRAICWASAAARAIALLVREEPTARKIQPRTRPLYSPFLLRRRRHVDLPLDQCRSAPSTPRLRRGPSPSPPLKRILITPSYEWGGIGCRLIHLLVYRLVISSKHINLFCLMENTHMYQGFPFNPHKDAFPLTKIGFLKSPTITLRRMISTYQTRFHK